MKLRIFEKLEEYNVTITNQEKMLRYLSEKSHYRYNLILEKLMKYCPDLSDTNLHDFYRYDIRLRRLLFKYLTAYEISLRGRILNSISEGFERVESLSFGQLIDQYYSDQKDLSKVKDLRNLIFHHRMIQLEDEVKVVSILDIMLRDLNRDKFYNELERLKEELSLIKAFTIIDGSIKYDYVRRD